MAFKVDIYDGRDPRGIPAYTIREAAHHLRLPQSTLRQWVAGSGRTEDGSPKYQRIIKPASDSPWILSFWNLVEAQVLATIRRKHHVAMQRVRTALAYVERELGVKRPLIRQEFQTDSVDLFIERYGLHQNLTEGWIDELTDDMKASLERIDRDPDGVARSFSPWARDPHEVKAVKIDPRVSFGRPVVIGSSVPTSVLADRFEAGEDPEDLAPDYDLSHEVILQAIRWELGKTA